MKVKTRSKIPKICLLPDDTIALYYEERAVSPTGEEQLLLRQKVLESSISHKLIVNEAVIFDVEEGDFARAQDGIGGAFLSCKEKED